MLRCEVLGANTNENARAAAGEFVRRNPSALQRVPRDFQQDPMLRIHMRSFFHGIPEVYGSKSANPSISPAHSIAAPYSGIDSLRSGGMRCTPSTPSISSRQ